jgi:hypothetical protein
MTARWGRPPHVPSSAGPMILGAIRVSLVGLSDGLLAPSVTTPILIIPRQLVESEENTPRVPSVPQHASDPGPPRRPGPDASLGATYPALTGGAPTHPYHALPVEHRGLTGRPDRPHHAEKPPGPMLLGRATKKYLAPCIPPATAGNPQRVLTPLD